jgi:hypothetical protein
VGYQSVETCYKATNMTEKLRNCTKQEQQSAVQVHMCSVWGQCSLNEVYMSGFSNVHKWPCTMTATECSGCPATTTTTQIKLILQKGTVTVNEPAKQLTISIRSAYSVEQDNDQFLDTHASMRT